MHFLNKFVKNDKKIGKQPSLKLKSEQFDIALFMPFWAHPLAWFLPARMADSAHVYTYGRLQLKRGLFSYFFIIFYKFIEILHDF